MRPSADRVTAIRAAAPAGVTTAGMDPVIESFSGRYQWLSNSSRHPVTLGSDTYPTAEEAFAAARTLHEHEQNRIAAALPLAGPTPQPSWCDARTGTPTAGTGRWDRFWPRSSPTPP